MQTRLGFIGIGTMGEPMAGNLLRSGTPLTVWNRTQAKTKGLEAAGAEVASIAAEVFAKSKIVFLMLIDATAIDEVLARGTPAFAERVRDRTIVQMGTPSPGYSKALEAEIRTAGGHYVEAPVSGSRKPAEAGALVALLAGEAAAIEQVRPWLKPMCRETLVCGVVPNALRMKLALNLFLAAVITGLAEAMHFAENWDLDLKQFVAAVEAGPMASEVSRVKSAKMLNRDFAAQASMLNVAANSALISEAAREAGVASPILDTCHALFQETLALGLAEADQIAVLNALEARTAAQA